MTWKKERRGGVKIESLVVGWLETNCYLIYKENSKKAALIDPGDEPEKILKWLQNKNVYLEDILLTHSHYDHIGALSLIKEKTKAPVSIHFLDKESLIETGITPEKLLKDKEKITVGEYVLEVLHTPGHTPGSICFKGEGFVFTGDSLFNGGVGRWDLPGGDEASLLKVIKEKLLILPEPTIIYPGHGAASSIGDEKKYNLYFR